MGDPVRAYLAQGIISEIKKHNLVPLVKSVGDHLQKSLSDLGKKYPTLIQNVRGAGTYMAFDAKDAVTRDNLIAAVRQKGLNMGGSGDRSIRLRPMLIFNHKHADIFLNILEPVLKTLSK